MTPSQTPGPEGELSALADPVRRKLYEFVVGHQAPVRRDLAASTSGISRPLAAYHLDRLVEAGLLITTYARPEGRSGPGAGRPAKLYQPARDEVSVTVPPRTYEVVAELLADAVAGDTTGQVRDAVLVAAEAQGRAAVDHGQDLLTTLHARGYEPELVDDQIALHNCPFHRLAQRHVDLVCGLNHALMRGLLAARSDDPDDARLAPQPGQCCVAIRHTPREGEQERLAI